MKTKTVKSKLSKPAKEVNYVIIDGKKVSKTWAAMLKSKNNPGIAIVDMRAVLK